MPTIYFRYKSQDEFLFNIPLSRPETQNSRILCFEDENIKSAVAHYEDTIPEVVENAKVDEPKEVDNTEDVLSTLKSTIEQLQNVNQFSSKCCRVRNINFFNFIVGSDY